MGLLFRVALVLTMTLACSPSEPTPAPAPATDAQSSTSPLAGAWAAPPHFMKLEADGTYVLEVRQMVDGCLTVKGNGYGLGRWSREGDTVLFVPEEEQASWILEPHGLAITFADAQASVVGDGLELTLADGSTHSFERTPAFHVFFPPQGR